MLEAWRDPDKRRALLLTVTIHLVVLLLLAVFLTAPRPRKLDQYVVVTLGAPPRASSETQAATAESPAPHTATPQVKSGAIGQPQARSAPKTQAQAPQPQQETEQPPAPPPASPAAPPAPQASQAQASQAQANRAQAGQAQAEQAQAQPSSPSNASQAAPQANAQAPTPQLQAPAAPAPPKTPADTTASVLPEINPPQVPPQQVPPSVTIPEPRAQAEVPQTTALAIAPQASVASPQKLSAPRPSAQVAAAQALAAPQASARVAAAQAVTAPQASAQVAAARSIPTPQANASVPRPVTAPQASAQVASAQAVTAPQASAQVAAAQAVTAPQASAQVASAQALAAPQASAQVEQPRALSAPQASASAGTARHVDIAPQVSVATPRSVPVPSVRAQVTAPTTAAGAPAASGAPAGNSDVATSIAGKHTPGGNAASPGQVGGEVQANAAGRGSAASPSGAASGAGAGTPSAAPFREELERPLAVLVDNVHGYPQSGLAQASSIIEMPVEGGLTRLMLVYDTSDPGKVGPIRSARDYFVALSQSMNAVLVHDGGSPGAMIAIKRAALPTLDALHRGDLFVRGGERSAPYNLYSEGGALRRAVNRLLPARPKVLSGSLYLPPKDAPTVTSVTDRFGKDYKTGFRYMPKLDNYRWVRNGTGANDASGENVLVDAVLLAKIDATPLPDDPEGRLYIPLQGGPATLYLHGQAVKGHWQVGDGVQFSTESGEPVDLAPYRTWVVMTPTYDRRVEQ